MARHDPAYKLLFSHPQMVRDLLVGFVREDWVAQLDYDSLEKVSSTYVSRNLRGRASDLVWRARLGKDWVYVYLMLEFQSTVDRYMSVRMLSYISLLYQDLIQSKQLSSDRRLPPVLPIVLYNGAKSWRAARDVASLIQSGPRALKPYLPRMRYLLVDEQQHAASGLTPDRNLVTALFRLESSRTHSEIRRALDALIVWLPGGEQSSLRRAFSVWLEDSIMPRVQGSPLSEIADLKEIRSMLSETIQMWKMEFRKEGLQKGHAQGHAQGHKQGHKQGLKEGLKEGLKRGLQKGLREGEAQVLLRQMQKRFGKLPRSVRLHVERASREQLQAWAEEILDAQSIDALIRHSSAV